MSSKMLNKSPEMSGSMKNMTSKSLCVVFLVFFLLPNPSVVAGGQKEPVDTGYCSMYNGKICKAHISSRQVWFSGLDGSGGYLNEQITTNLFDEMISELPPICRAAAEVSPYTISMRSSPP